MVHKTRNCENKTQANLSVGVRYGHSAEIGSRRVMEDRTAVVNDIFRPEPPLSLRNRASGSNLVFGSPPRHTSVGTVRDKKSCPMIFFPSSPAAAAAAGVDPAAAVVSPMAMVSPIAVTVTPRASTLPVEKEAEPGAASAIVETAGATVDGRATARLTTVTNTVVTPVPGGTGTGNTDVEGEGGWGKGAPPPPPAAAFFAVYDGHDGDVVAETLHRSLHQRIAKQVKPNITVSPSAKM